MQWEPGKLMLRHSVPVKTIPFASFRKILEALLAAEFNAALYLVTRTNIKYTIQYNSCDWKSNLQTSRL